MIFPSNSTLCGSLFLAGGALLLLLSCLTPAELYAQDQRLLFERLPLRGLPHTTVRTILQDRKGFMWFGTDDGLVRYDGHGYSVFKPDMGFDAGNPYTVVTMFEDAQGILWIGTGKNGLNRFDPSTEQFTTYQHDPDDPNSISHDAARRVVGGRNGIVWVGTAWEGFNRFEPETGTFTRYATNPSDPDNGTGRAVQSMLEDRNGILWIGTRHAGLSRFDPDTGQFTRYLHNSADQNVRDDWVSSIGEGSLDVSTTNWATR